MFGFFDDPKTKKIKGMYIKSLENFNMVAAKNVENFKEHPLASFEVWYEHYYSKTLETEIGNATLYANIKQCPLERLIKPLIMLGSLNYYVESKTHRNALEQLLEFAPLIDKKDIETLNFIQAFFGGFLEDGVSRVPKKS